MHDPAAPDILRFQNIPVQIGCGQMTSENGSYIVQSSSTTPKNIQQGGCMVKICPLNKDVCRIRYDLDVSI